MSNLVWQKPNTDKNWILTIIQIYVHILNVSETYKDKVNKQV